ncbi:glycosyltransferase family protein [Marinicrinis lubricantis]|uniref:Glycosyltransferase n=1 Tax=Marinicrinis lubricantis TaxID=2086470 RepID=A0ABW1IK09_9BACL
MGELRYRSIHDLVIPLLKTDLNVKIWGKHWEGIGLFYPDMKVPKLMYQGILPFQQTPRVFSSTKINISIQTCKDQLSNRTLDILASGGFLLTSNTKAVREKLRPGINCIASNSPEETLDLVTYYLDHDNERKLIAEHGRELAVQQFDYTRTLQKIWYEIETE